MPNDEAIAAWRGQSLDALIERFTRAGLHDGPGSWAASEQTEDIAQYTRYLFLRGLWRMLLPAHQRCTDAAVALLDGGESDPRREQVSLAVAAALGELAFGLLYQLSFPGGAADHDLVDGEPTWRLMEELGGSLTGREVGALHESLWSAHPEGEEGASSGGWF